MRVWLVGMLLLALVPAIVAATAPRRAIPDAAIESVVARLVARHGAAETARIRAGAIQVAARWWEEDGDPAAYEAFCVEHWLSTEASRREALDRIQAVLEEIDGRVHEIRRIVTTPLDLDTGPLAPVDRLFGDLDLGSDLDAGLYKTRVAFFALLNFPVESLPARLKEGAGWDRERWARSRMMDRFAVRIPAAVGQEATRAFTAAGRYIADYFIRLDRLVARDGTRPFPEGLRLTTHWGLRDELKSHYGAGEAGLLRQRTIYEAMKRIVRQEIPAAVVDNPALAWNPFTNAVTPEASGGREPDTRYARLLEVFRAVRAIDPYAPTAPTYIRRRFELDRQIPEDEVERLLVSVLASSEVKALAARIREALGRPLEPFDIWYSGFTPRAGVAESDLDAAVRTRYPDVAAFQAALPATLRALGFSEPKAAWLAERIVVDPSRGAGHAMPAVRREDKARLRTRIPAAGMDYKGFNIAIHELGHNVEQVFSLHGIDAWFLAGVPNNAITEAFAFVFQARDLELLGMAGAGDERRRLEALNDLWATYEIGGVALVDMRVWRWMYAHPDASPAELREAVLAIAREVWNLHYAPIFGVKDVEILAVYSHMISNALYLPDYPLGHIVGFQIAAALRKGDFGAEFERMAKLGRLTPDEWMRRAVGAPISPKALLDAAREAMTAR